MCNLNPDRFTVRCSAFLPITDCIGFFENDGFPNTKDDALGKILITSKIPGYAEIAEIPIPGCSDYFITIPLWEGCFWHLCTY